MDLREHNHSQRAAEVVHRLLIKHGWQLLDQEVFIQRVVSALDEQSRDEVVYVAYRVYNEALYEACTGTEGLERRERAYTELSQVLYNQAQKSYPDVLEESVHKALADVAARLHRCNRPQSFIPFALSLLLKAARELRGH